MNDPTAGAAPAAMAVTGATPLRALGAGESESLLSSLMEKLPKIARGMNPGMAEDLSQEGLMKGFQHMSEGVPAHLQGADLEEHLTNVARRHMEGILKQTKKIASHEGVSLDEGGTLMSDKSGAPSEGYSKGIAPERAKPVQTVMPTDARQVLATVQALKPGGGSGLDELHRNLAQKNLVQGISRRNLRDAYQSFDDHDFRDASQAAQQLGLTKATPARVFNAGGIHPEAVHNAIQQVISEQPSGRGFAPAGRMTAPALRYLVNDEAPGDIARSLGYRQPGQLRTFFNDLQNISKGVMEKLKPQH
jgi:hypothetical protein